MIKTKETMKINELIEHLTKLKESGYGEYEAKVAYSSGCYCNASGFSVDVLNKTVKIY